MIDGCRRGDREAQRRLYEDTSPKIYRLMLRMTRHPDDAFDLTQETYVRALTQIEQFDARSSLTTWVFRIAVNQALQFLRRRDLGRAKVQDLRERQAGAAGADPRDTRIDVRQALTTLEVDEQAILLLRYHEGLSYQEIADVLECAGGTVASRLNRSRQRLKSRLQESYGPAEESDPAKHLRVSGSDTTLRQSRIESESDSLPG